MSTAGINPRPRRRPGPPSDPQVPPQKSVGDGDEPPADDDDDKVGYCRPPKKHRFPPGVSGNPKGPVKGTRSLIKLIDRAMDVKLEFTEQGKKRKLSKREITALQVSNKATKGDAKTIEMLIRQERGGSQEALEIASAVANVAAAAAPLSEGEESILDHFMAAAREAVERERGGE